MQQLKSCYLGQPQKQSIRDQFDRASNAENNPIPLHEKDTINLEYKTFKNGKIDGFNAVNLQFILKTGVVHARVGTYEDREQMFININADDAFSESLEQVRSEARKKIENDPQLSELLEKEKWSRDDRVAWEKKTSQIVSDEVDKIPAFSKYRDAKIEKDGIKLNDLSNDMNNNIQKQRFVCAEMSAVEGITLQRLENEILPKKSDPDDFKKQSNYFLSGGLVAQTREGYKPSPHAYIISSATGNVIEATRYKGESPYMEALDKTHTFEKFVKGEITPFGNLYNYYGGNAYGENSTLTTKNINSDASQYKQQSIVHAVEQTKAFLEKSKEYKNIPNMEQLKEAVVSTHGQKQIDPHLADMIHEMIKQPDMSQNLRSIENNLYEVFDSWKTALELNKNDPLALQQIKNAYNQYSSQIDSSIQDTPYIEDGKITYLSADANQWKENNIEKIPDQTQPSPTVIAQNTQNKATP